MARITTSSASAPPGYVFVMAASTPKSTVGSWTFGPNVGRLFDCAANTAVNAQNNEIAWDVALDAGTWTFNLFSVKSSDQCIYTVLVDGVSVGTIDAYSASVTNFIGSITGVVVASSGRQTVTLRAATKNASSTNYGMNISGFSFTRTGA